MVCPSSGSKSCLSYLALAELSMWARYLLNVVKGSSVLLSKSDLKTSRAWLVTPQRMRLLRFVLHEEAHDISFLVMMPQISRRGKRHRFPSQGVQFCTDWHLRFWYACSSSRTIHRSGPVTLVMAQRGPGARCVAPKPRLAYRRSPIMPIRSLLSEAKLSPIRPRYRLRRLMTPGIENDLGPRQGPAGDFRGTLRSSRTCRPARRPWWRSRRQWPSRCARPA